MVINEVFPNPTVKQVIFQIRYPNLFYIEDKIGALQTKLMKDFPESSLLHEHRFRITDEGFDLEKTSDEKTGKAVKKIWSFESTKKTKLHILTDSLDISSHFHKTYNNPDSADKFRDVIDLVLKHFFEATQIPIVKRIGLRYIDECPIPKKDTKIFKEFYKTTFPLGRFKLEDATDMNFSTVVKRGKYNLRFVEKLVRLGNKYKLILDFDGFGVNIKSENCLNVSDNLHNLILNEYKKSIKEPVYRHMRTKTRKKK